MATFHKVSIKEVIRETANAVSLIFDIPGNLKSNFALSMLGNILTLAKRQLMVQQVRRAYSICSAPQSGCLLQGRSKGC